MGLFSSLINGSYTAKPVVPPVVSPWMDTELVTALESELFGVDTGIVTVDTAKKVPALNRALQVHSTLLGGLPLELHTNGVRAEVQPRFLYDTDDVTLSPYLRTVGMVTDLFLHGIALLGAYDGEDGLPADAIHIPREFWTINNQGQIEIDERIDKKYHAHPILIPLGSNGVMVDAIDSIRSYRKIQGIMSDRLDSPVAQTLLKILDADANLTPAEKKKVVSEYIKGRNQPGGAVALVPFGIEVETQGTIQAELFTEERNQTRLDIANHSSVPASLLEGSKAGGGGDINYSNEGATRNELWDFGTSRFANAIEARLSKNDVTPPGSTIRFNRASLMEVPTPPYSAPTED